MKWFHLLVWRFSCRNYCNTTDESIVQYDLPTWSCGPINDISVLAVVIMWVDPYDHAMSEKLVSCFRSIEDELLSLNHIRAAERLVTLGAVEYNRGTRQTASTINTASQPYQASLIVVHGRCQPPDRSDLIEIYKSAQHRRWGSFSNDIERNWHHHWYGVLMDSCLECFVSLCMGRISIGSFIRDLMTHC